MKWRQLLSACLELLRHMAETKWRVVAAAAAVILAIGVMAATVTLSSVSQALVAQRFNAVRATLVTVRKTPIEGGGVDVADATFTLADWQRARTVPDVTGTVVESGYGDVAVQTAVRRHRGLAPDQAMNLVAASDGLLESRGCVLDEGALHNRWLNQPGPALVYLGVSAARSLAVVEGSSIVVAGRRVRIAGIFSRCGKETALLSSVVMGFREAVSLLGLPRGDSTLEVSVKPGAADRVAELVPLALAPENPSRFSAVSVPEARTFRAIIEGDTRSVMLAVSAATLVVGMMTMMSAAIVRVLEQRRDIGLRRALGSSKKRIIFEVLGETVLIGFFAGLAGAVIGYSAVLVAALEMGWPLRPPSVWLLLLAAMGALTGLLAGAFAARRAGRIEPWECLRSQ